MAAAATDKLKKLSRRWVGQIGSGGVSDETVTTIPLSSTTNLPTDTAVLAVIDRVDANGTATASLEETVIGVVSGSNLVSCVRGAEGTAQAHNAGAVVEILVTAKGWNDIVDHLLVQHNQDGTHKAATVTTLKATGAEINTGTEDAKIVTPKAIADSKLTDAVRGDGWITSADTWTYASATTFTIAGVDRTAMFPKGTKLKLTQTTDKYFYVVGSAFSTNTTITITGGSSYTFANAAVTSPFYSYAETPQAFPAYFAYTPTFGGFSSQPTVVAGFTLNGTTCHVWSMTTSGNTSNNTAWTITVPITSANIAGTSWIFYVSGFDNGARLTAPGRGVLAANTVTASIYKSFGVDGWTASGSGNVEFNFSYEI